MCSQSIGMRSAFPWKLSPSVFCKYFPHKHTYIIIFTYKTVLTYISMFNSLCQATEIKSLSLSLSGNSQAKCILNSRQHSVHFSWCSEKMNLPGKETLPHSVNQEQDPAVFARRSEYILKPDNSLIFHISLPWEEAEWKVSDTDICSHLGSTRQ